MIEYFYRLYYYYFGNKEIKQTTYNNDFIITKEQADRLANLSNMGVSSKQLAGILKKMKS